MQNVISLIYSEYTCSICLEILRDPHHNSLCPHLFCLECIKKIQKCALCKLEIKKYYPSPTTKNILESIQKKIIQCKYCSINTTVVEYNNHKTICDKFPHKCEYCNNKFTNLEQHKLSCSITKINCEFCNYTYTNQELIQHKT